MISTLNEFFCTHTIYRLARSLYSARMHEWLSGYRLVLHKLPLNCSTLFERLDCGTEVADDKQFLRLQFQL